MGDGDGTFGATTQWTAPIGTWTVIATDFDGDGRDDIAAASSDSSMLSILRNDAVPGSNVTPAGAQDLGSVSLGATATRTFTMSSTGTYALRVGTASVTGAGLQLTADGCSGKLLPAGSDCTVTVEFAPSAAGQVSGTLTVPTDDANVTRAMSATGVDPSAPGPQETPTPVPPVDPTPTPQPPAPEPPVATPAPPAATPVPPSTKEAPCKSRRIVLVHTPARLRGGTVTIAMGTRRVGRIARAGAVVKVDLRGLPRGTARVTFERGAARDVRSYRTCA